MRKPAPPIKHPATLIAHELHANSRFVTLQLKHTAYHPPAAGPTDSLVLALTPADCEALAMALLNKAAEVDAMRDRSAAGQG